MKKQNDIGFERNVRHIRHSIAPQNIDEHNWYYEEKDGVEIIHQVTSGPQNRVRTDSILIPWDKLTDTMRRHLGTYN
jgi:hypothetical protein